MKRNVIYWKTSDMERKKEVKAALGITSVSVNGESEYKGDIKKLDPYIEEGIMIIRTKDEQEVRRKKVCFDTKQSQSFNGKEVRRSCRKRKV